MQAFHKYTTVGIVISTEDYSLGYCFEEIGLKMYFFFVVVLVLEDRTHMQTVLARFCDGVGVFIVNAFPFLAKITFFPFDIHRKLLT